MDWRPFKTPWNDLSLVPDVENNNVTFKFSEAYSEWRTKKLQQYEISKVNQEN